MAPCLHPARLDALELLGEEGLVDELVTVAGGLRMAGMGADELREGPCSSVGEAGACAIGCSRTFYCEFLRVSVCFVILAMLVVSACRVKCITIA